MNDFPIRHVYTLFIKYVGSDISNIKNNTDVQTNNDELMQAITVKILNTFISH